MVVESIDSSRISGSQSVLCLIWKIVRWEWMFLLAHFFVGLGPAPHFLKCRTMQFCMLPYLLKFILKNCPSFTCLLFKIIFLCVNEMMYPFLKGKKTSSTFFFFLPFPWLLYLSGGYLSFLSLRILISFLQDIYIVLNC